MKHERQLHTMALATLLGTLFVLGTGCSKQAFVVGEQEQAQKAPGTFVVAPRVDILLAEDDTGSMYEPFEEVNAQMKVFLNNLEKNGWDYHFATTPLTTDRALEQIAASRHDTNWAGEWTPPYPGADESSVKPVQPHLFRFPDQYTGFLTPGELYNSKNGDEPGIANIRHALKVRVKDTGFLRDDAILAVIIVGNGEDTSGVTICTRNDGYTGPCEQVGFPEKGTMESSLEQQRQDLFSLKTSPQMVRVYAAVAHKARDNCFGGASRIGSRYMKLATSTGGETYDVCSEEIDSILTAMGTHLQTSKGHFRRRYLMLNQEPDPASIQVIRSNGEEIIQDATEGWTYAGYMHGIYTIDAPTDMGKATGYAIELHGSARLIGDETATVNFKPFGAQDSVK